MKSSTLFHSLERQHRVGFNSLWIDVYGKVRLDKSIKGVIDGQSTHVLNFGLTALLIK